MTPNTHEPRLVLRFRDLSVARGDTIKEHRVIIAREEICWWGWWSRAHELSPCEWLGSLTLPRTVYLFDTDQDRVYAAECAEILCGSAEVLSPSPILTPDYYSNRRLKAWFRFTDIVPTEGEDILERECQRTTASPEELGWSASDLHFLKSRPATMWLLRGEME
jgi:hypothetical protein